MQILTLKKSIKTAIRTEGKILGSHLLYCIFKDKASYIFMNKKEKQEQWKSIISAAVKLIKAGMNKVY